MKRIMITGATGFIGRALAAEGVAKGHSVFGIGSDSGFGQMPAGLAGETAMRLPDDGLVKLVEDFQPEIFFHCAGSALPAKSFTSPSHDFQCSVPVVQHLLEAVRRSAPAAHVVLLSSAAVYGQPVSLPVSEDVVPAPVSPYGFHKWLGEILSREYAEIYGLRVSSARIFSAYGPQLRKQVVWDSIRKLANPGGAEFPGTGAETRDFIFIDDLTDALYRICRRDGSGHEVVNVGSGVETRISDVVEVVARHLGIPADRWRFSGESDRAVPSNWRADISTLQALGFVPSISFDEGVRRTVEWSRNEQPEKSGLFSRRTFPVGE